jgi:predicted Holliday junction resolvase-like endonuclease
LPEALTFQGLPPFNQSQPKGPVFGVAGRSGKAAAFIGTSSEFVVRNGLSSFHDKVFVVRGALFIKNKSGTKSREHPAG